MIIDNRSLFNLRERVKERLSEKRYNHTLGVERMAEYIGNILLPGLIAELKAAALLHDIAKEIPYDSQIELLANSGISLSDEDLDTKPAIHSFAAVPLIKHDFSEYATKNVLSSVLNHTLGAPQMSLFDEIIFISDYAEEGRTYPTCVSVNNFIKENIRKDRNQADNLSALHIATLKAIDATVESLQRRGEVINGRTISTQKYFREIL